MDYIIEPFLEALAAEIAIIAEQNPYKQIGTIFFGGGTPTLLLPEQFDKLLSQIQENFDIVEGAEISTEANPNDLSVAYLRGIRDVGINRISIGMQSANKGELDLFARRHHHETVIQAVEDARTAGFDNLNLDVMYGFPHQTLNSWEFSLNELIDLNPEHISMYALGLEANTAMLAWVEKGLLPTPDDDLAADMYDLATEMVKPHGYVQYEICNWSKPGYMCRHNLQYWRNHPYVGLGPGAHGFAAGVRYATILSPRQYIKRLREDAGKYVFPRSPATDVANLVSWKEEIAETLIMSLRLTGEGVKRNDFRQRFGVDVMDLHGEVFQRFTTQGLLEIQTEFIRLTEPGRLLSNLIFRELV
jgi:oxygen-independent coproporphyrinogen III oxidase